MKDFTWLASKYGFNGIWNAHMHINWNAENIAKAFKEQIDSWESMITLNNGFIDKEMQLFSATVESEKSFPDKDFLMSFNRIRTQVETYRRQIVEYNTEIRIYKHEHNKLCKQGEHL